MSESISRSWFVVLNNPQNYYNGTPEQILNTLKDLWIRDNPLRKGYWAYCISADGLEHIHMVLEHSAAMRFSLIKRTYPKAHLEPTKGSKAEVKSYIKKEGKYAEKGEKVIATVSHGNIEGFKRYALNSREDVLLTIESMIEDGKTPNEIMSEDIRFRKEESVIRKAFFAKRYKETPPIRKVNVIWHLGESGSGKSYTYVRLCEKYGDDNVYFFSDFSNSGVGGFDNYCGEPYLFIDELKGNALPYELLLTILQGYRSQIHCRYANCYTLWSEVHITSIYAPEDIYFSTVKRELQSKDNVQQLLRRINKYVYHYIENEKYKTVEIEDKDYKGYEQIKNQLKTKEL